ncbi:Transcription factor SPATULA [Zea mays]|uniref:Transcription factor SPATULA n=1 Tax=Zea mays TaxID=4577 RepID=A0A1D6HNP8_MAIZE|nr:Transcription factor SPATULA [Zea mays]
MLAAARAKLLCCAVGGGGGSGSGTAAGAVMDAQQQLDLVMRHQSMATVCESEDALGSSESDPARPARPRGKRSRAAEVHNLSEKVGAGCVAEEEEQDQREDEGAADPHTQLEQGCFAVLVTWTDKASMLDDAIEYLKHLQLQVQMLSMRNGLYLPPGNLSGAPETLAPLEMCAALNQSGAKASNSGVVVLPGNKIPVARLLLDPPNHDQRHENPLVLQSVPSSSTAVEPRFLQQPAQPNLQSFQLAVPPEMIFDEADMMLKHRLASGRETTSLPVGHEAKPGRQEACMVNSDISNRGSLGKEVFMPYLHSLQSGDTEGGLRAGSN